MHYLRRLNLALLLAVASACGDDGSDDTKGKPDASDSKACPASGEPAVVDCPCKRPKGEYCCGIGRGVICDDDKRWIAFYDSPCHPADGEDAGGKFNPPVPIIECR